MDNDRIEALKENELASSEQLERRAALAKMAQAAAAAGIGVAAILKSRRALAGQGSGGGVV